jgi:hypothetical protein
MVVYVGHGQRVNEKGSLPVFAIHREFTPMYNWYVYVRHTPRKPHTHCDMSAVHCTALHCQCCQRLCGGGLWDI